MNVPPHPSGPLPWPQWAYVPGEAAGLDADYQTLDIAKALVPSAFRGYVPALTALLQAKLGRAQLTKADWIALSAIVRSQQSS